MFIHGTELSRHPCIRTRSQNQEERFKEGKTEKGLSSAFAVLCFHASTCQIKVILKQVQGLSDTGQRKNWLNRRKGQQTSSKCKNRFTQFSDLLLNIHAFSPATWIYFRFHCTYGFMNLPLFRSPALSCSVILCV